MRPVRHRSENTLRSVLHFGVVLGLAVGPVTASAESSRAVGGAKFLGANERGHRFDQPFVPTGCRSISENLGICLEESGYILEDSRADGRNRAELFRLNDIQDAGIKSIFFPLRESLELSPDALDDFVARHAYDVSVRGPRTLDRVIYERRSPQNYLITTATEITDAEGHQSLMILTVLRQQWGVGLIETTTRILPDNVAGEVPLGAAEDRHAAFLDIVRTKVNVGPGYQ